MAAIVDNEEKQLAGSETDMSKKTTQVENVCNENHENNQENDDSTPATFDLADKYFENAKKLLKENKVGEAIECALDAVNIGEKSTEDVNDIRLAKYFLQYGKSLLAKIQQANELLLDDTMVEVENEETVNQDSTENGNNGTNDESMAVDEKTVEKGNGKAEIDNDEEEEDFDVANDEKKVNGDNDDTTNNNEENFDYDENENENEELDERGHCWQMLETARFIVAKHLTKLGVELENDEMDDELNDITEENDENGDNDNDNNDNNDNNESGQTETATETETTTETQTETKEKEKEKEKESENVTDEESENEKRKYMILLAEVYSLLGDQELEDNEFAKSLNSFEQALHLRELCNESNRELAFSHYMAALAASHAREFDIMGDHCNEAIDLLNDRILTLIDSFENAKYSDKTSDENLDEEGLFALVTEFEKEYNSKMDSLTSEEQEKVKEINDLMELMQEINDKMENDLIDAKNLKEIEEQEGSIKELVMKMLLQNNFNKNENNNNENENDNDNDNNNNNNNNENTNISGISFGDNSKTSTTDENSKDVVNTLCVKSNKGKKRSMEDAGFGNLDENDDADAAPMKMAKTNANQKTVHDAVKASTTNDVNGAVKQ